MRECIKVVTQQHMSHEKGIPPHLMVLRNGGHITVSAVINEEPTLA